MEVNGQQWVPLCARVRERPTDINKVRRVHKHPLCRHRHSLASAPSPPAPATASGRPFTWLVLPSAASSSGNSRGWIESRNLQNSKVDR